MKINNHGRQKSEQIDLNNYKGIFYNDETVNRYEDPITGAHFDYFEMCKTLKALQKYLYSGTSSTVYEETLSDSENYEYIAPVFVHITEQKQINKDNESNSFLEKYKNLPAQQSGRNTFSQQGFGKNPINHVETESSRLFGTFLKNAENLNEHKKPLKLMKINLDPRKYQETIRRIFQHRCSNRTSELTKSVALKLSIKENSGMNSTKALHKMPDIFSNSKEPVFRQNREYFYTNSILNRTSPIPAKNMCILQKSKIAEILKNFNSRNSVDLRVPISSFTEKSKQQVSLKNTIKNYREHIKSDLEIHCNTVDLQPKAKIKNEKYVIKVGISKFRSSAIKPVMPESCKNANYNSARKPQLLGLLSPLNNNMPRISVL